MPDFLPSLIVRCTTSAPTGPIGAVMTMPTIIPLMKSVKSIPETQVTLYPKRNNFSQAEDTIEKNTYPESNYQY
jgi:hypothetical protein